MQRWFALGFARAAAVVLAIAAPLVLLAPAATAQTERIRSFASDIEVRADGSMLVTETITVNAEGRQIRRGIFRDFPTMYRGKWGLRTHVPFEVVSVTRDGSAEPYAVEGLENGVRIRIGREEVMLPPGEHTYTIAYETANQLGFFENHDELYWNVTGTGWKFPIDTIRARVSLPAPVDPADIQLEGFTGKQDEARKDFAASVVEPGVVEFETTRPQPQGGNMTIVIGWPKGVVDESIAKGGIGSALRANLFLILITGGVVAAFVYLHLAWIRVGRDPMKGTITPRLVPPKGLSPGACRYLHRMKHDDTAYASALFSLAVAGVIAIRVDDDESYEIERLDPDATPAFPDEKAIAKVVVPTKDDESFAFEQGNHEKISRSIDAQKKSLKKDYGHLFSTNRVPLLIGFGIVAVGWIAGVLTLPLPAMAMTGFMSVWLSFWSIACLALVIGAGASWVAVVRGGEKSKIPTAILLTLFAVPFCAAWGFGVYMISQPTTFWTPVVLVAAAGLLVLYAFLLPAPTFEGRRIMDEIEGFVLYLRGGRTDGDPARGGRPPGGIDADEFERWLPYAVALDAADDWAAYFEGVVESKLREEDQRELARREWNPVWLHGPLHMLHPTAFCDSIGSSLATSVSSSSSAPGSSSGFSGGGSSGGGGGGGGGGGW